MEYIISFLVAFVACSAFSALFHAPSKQYIFCGLTGGISWLSYQLVGHLSGHNITACFVAALLAACSSMMKGRVQTEHDKNTSSGVNQEA